MYELSVEREFCAAHALVIRGTREPLHGHNFRITVTVVGDRLGADGMLVDFHALERLVASVVRPFDNADLTTIPPFDRPSFAPSAERITEHIALAVAEGLPRLVSTQGPALRLSSVRLTEAPGCSVTYRP